MNRLFIFNIDRVISFLRLGSKHFLPDFNPVNKQIGYPQFWKANQLTQDGSTYGNSVIAVNGDEKVDLENTKLYQKTSRLVIHLS